MANVRNIFLILVFVCLSILLVNSFSADRQSFYVIRKPYRNRTTRIIQKANPDVIIGGNNKLTGLRFPVSRIFIDNNVDSIYGDCPTGYRRIFGGRCRRIFIG